MRYAQGGGLTPKQQAAREQLRLGAAERFVRGAVTRHTGSGLSGTGRSVMALTDLTGFTGTREHGKEN
jgi:putative transposase